MAVEVHYLGSANVGYRGKRTPPGELVLTRPIDQMTEGELDLLIAKQRLEIEKMNMARVAGPDHYKVAKYDRALEVINGCLANVHNPDYITGIGIGAAKKKKKGLGKFFQKVGQGIKKGAKAVSKVVTAPLRLIAKGAMEIYLPKAAPAFLYLFAPEAGMPDKMLSKRRKSERFKKFIVGKIGMKDKHFMGIVRNRLTKMYGRSPESFLADALKKTAVAYVGYPGQNMARVNMHRYGNIAGIGNNGRGKKQKPALKRLRAPAPVPLLRTGPAPAPTALLQNRVTPNFAYNPRQTYSKKNSGANILKSAAKGDLVGAIMAAIGWLVSKLGGSKADALTPDDMPDIAADTGNAFQYGDLKNDYGNLDVNQRGTVKEVATDLIEQQLTRSEALQHLERRVPFLNQQQQQEIAYEVEEGFEPLPQADSSRYANAIKRNVIDPTGEDLQKLEQSGGGSVGACKC